MRYGLFSVRVLLSFLSISSIRAHCVCRAPFEYDPIEFYLIRKHEVIRSNKSKECVVCGMDRV